MNEIEQAVKFLKDGELVAIPTETVYGLAGDATNSEAIKKIYEVKGRPSNNPLILHAASADILNRYVNVPPEHQETFELLLKEFSPGPITFVLPKSTAGIEKISQLVSGKSNTLAVRIPFHPIARKVLEEFGGVVAAPSANLSNYISPTTAEHVKRGLGSKIKLIVDGGPCEHGLESTVISLLYGEAPTLLRPGVITLEDLKRVSNKDFLFKEPKDDLPLTSPGQLQIHYSPRTPLIFRSNKLTDYPKHVGLLEFLPSKHEIEFAAVETLSNDGDLEKIANLLFSSLRKLDEAGLDLIITDSCKPIGLGLAIMDRLNKAVHKA